MKYYPNIGEVEYRLSKRAKRVNITITREGNVRVSMPLGFPFKDAELFLLSKEKWIVNCKKKLSKRVEEHRTVFTETTQFSTKTRKLQITYEDRANARVMLGSNSLDIYLPASINILDDPVQEIIRKAIEHSWKEEAHSILPKRLKELADKHNFNYSKLEIKKVKTFWGKCTSTKSISLNLYLMNLPDYLIDYVILHELCHTVYMNHGKKFWALLDKVCGISAKILNKEMKQYSSRYF